MESNWVEYKCKSGQTLFIYNKVTGEHKWPTNNSTEESYAMFGQSVIYKELKTIGTQTDDNGCDNGCTSMYITASHSLENTEISANKIGDNLDVESAVHHGLDGFGNGEKIPQPHSEDDNGCTSVSITGCHSLENTEISANEIEDNLDVESAVCHGLDGSVENSPLSHSKDDNGCSSMCITGCHTFQNTEISANEIQHNTDIAPKHSAVDYGLDGYFKFKCSYCRRRFATKRALALHIRIHTGKDPLECSYCQKKFYTKVDLNTHMKTHTEEKPFKCPYCEKTFATKGNLYYHIPTHNIRYLFECPYCKNKFASKRHLSHHVRTHTKVKLFECPYCNKLLKAKRNLEYHMRTHTGRNSFGCTYCKKTFASKATLRLHTRIHTGENLYECSYCKKKFTAKCNFERHVRTHTGNKKRFECSNCKKEFSTQGSLDRHVKVHTGDQPFECTYCKTQFERKSSLEDHMKKHCRKKVI